MNTLDYILDKYNVRDQEPPIKLECTRWATMPRLFRQLGYTLGVEVGVEVGRFSKSLCMGNPLLKVYGVDAWEVYPGYKEDHKQEHFDKLYQEAKERLKPYNCQIIKDYSMNAVKRFADESIDFVFIDAAHDYGHVKEDIKEWSKKVRKGGIISGHDYVNGVNGQTFGVKPAVNEWVKKNKKILFLLVKGANRDQCPSWLYVK